MELSTASPRTANPAGFLLFDFFAGPCSAFPSPPCWLSARMQSTAATASFLACRHFESSCAMLCQEFVPVNQRVGCGERCTSMLGSSCCTVALLASRLALLALFFGLSLAARESVSPRVSSSNLTSTAAACLLPLCLGWVSFTLGLSSGTLAAISSAAFPVVTLCAVNRLPLPALPATATERA